MPPRGARSARHKKIAEKSPEIKGASKRTLTKKIDIVDKDIEDPLYISENDLLEANKLTTKRARSDDTPFDSDEDYKNTSRTKRIKKRNLSDETSQSQTDVNGKIAKTKKKAAKGKSEKPTSTNGDNVDKSEIEMVSGKPKGKKVANESLPDIVLSVKSIEKKNTGKLDGDKGEKPKNVRGKKAENKIVESAEQSLSGHGDDDVNSEVGEMCFHVEEKGNKGKSRKNTPKNLDKIPETVPSLSDGIGNTEDISSEKQQPASKGKGRKDQKKNQKKQEHNMEEQIEPVVQKASLKIEGIEDGDLKTATNGRGRKTQNKKHQDNKVEEVSEVMQGDSKPVLKRRGHKIQNEVEKPVEEEESVSESSNNFEKMEEALKRGRARKPNKPLELDLAVDEIKNLEEKLEPEKPKGKARAKKLQKQQSNEDEFDNKNEHLESDDVCVDYEPRPKQAAKGKRNAPKTNHEESAGEPVPKKIKSEDKKPALKNKASTAYEEIDFTNTSKNLKGDPWNIKICSWNVDGIRAWLSKGGLDYIKYEKPDILCLQETKCAQDKLPAEVTAIPGYHPYWLCSDQDGYAGVAIYTTKMAINVQNGLQDEELDGEGRIITAEYEQFYLICTYVPNAGRKLVTLPKRLKWNEKFHKYVKNLDQKKPVIICGDMNVAHNEIDLANPKNNKKNAGFTAEEREGMTKLLGDGFVDTYRHLYPKQSGAYTFWTYMMNSRAKNVGWRLDYMIISERLVPMLCDHVIRSDVYGSDHCPIALMLNLSSIPKLPKE